MHFTHTALSDSLSSERFYDRDKLRQAISLDKASRPHVENTDYALVNAILVSLDVECQLELPHMNAVPYSPSPIQVEMGLSLPPASSSVE